MKLLVILQNAWRYRAGRSWQYAGWVRALARSRTGRRLTTILGEDCFSQQEICFGNASPLIGVNADSKFPPDEDHVQNLLDGTSPEVVLACGRSAEKATVKLWKGPLLCVPHPASRVLTNVLLMEANRLLYGGEAFLRRVALRQGRGCVIEENVGYVSNIAV